MVSPTILQSDMVVQMLLPFVLVFTVIFAILQKSKILGDGKKQIDAIVSLVIGLIVVSYAKAVGIIINLMPFLAVAVVVLLVFLLIWGMVFVDEKFGVPKSVKTTVGVLAAIGVVATLAYITPVWGYLLDLFNGGDSSIISNIIIFAVVIAAIGVVVGFSGKKEDKKS